MWNQRSRKALRYISISFVGFLFVACNNVGSARQMDFNSMDLMASQSGQAVTQEKVHLDDATLEQVSEHTAVCPSNKKHLCVQLCHRPPGNPDNFKNMYLPLKSTAAHLRHGGKHVHHDYLGDCRDEDMMNDDDSSDDDAMDEGSQDDDSSDDRGHGNCHNNNNNDEGNVEDPVDDSAGEGDIPGEDVTGGDMTPPETIPNWCLPIIDIDSNCDGYDDETGAPLL